MVKKIVILVLSALAFWSAYKFAQILTPPNVPKLKENNYWGPGNPKPDDTSIRPFKINIPEKVIQDLNTRLDRTRDLTPPLEGIEFQYGFNTDTLKKILTFWRKDYNWRQRETFLNQFPQYKTQIQGLDIHFIHVKPKITTNSIIKKTLPLLLLHGWPGSIREFYSLIPLLTTEPQGDADFVFEIIAPSLPGYGFSQAAAKPGMGPGEMAIIFKNLMKRLGHDRFYIQGGDWGSAIGSTMVTLFPDVVFGFHSNMCHELAGTSLGKLFLGAILPSVVVSPEHQHRLYPLSNLFSLMLEEFGYSHIQATKPDTVGVALTDSPAGLAAYILEKYSTWTNPAWKTEKDGGLLKKYNYVDLLDNIMIYWVTNSITSSMRLYAETINKRYTNMQLSNIPTNVPVACVRFQNELIYLPESLLAHKYQNLVHSIDFDDGGHFAAFEVPKIMAKDIWAAILKMENNKK